MAIRQKRKEVELPPAHLYLEDIEEIIRLMVEFENTRKRNPENKEITLAFTVGKKQCDTVDDLKSIGGSWHEFKVEVNDRSSFNVNRFAGANLYLYDHGETFPKVLRLMTARESRLRSTLRRIPYWLLVFWPYSVWIILHRLLGTTVGDTLFTFLAGFPLLVALWAIYAHTIVELRYSHDPSPKLAWFKERGEKVGWLVVGTFLTLVVQWLWKRFNHQ
jgi:hypothetical protein